MTTFIQLHFLTAYAPSNLNRDDTGRPKTAHMGGYERLRVSSQSLKRAWRISDTFQSALAGHIGIRTRRIGRDCVYEPMLTAGIDKKLALAASEKILKVFGDQDVDKASKDPRDSLGLKQLVHISMHEKNLIDQLVQTLIMANRGPNEEELELLRKDQRSVDIALFGRMLASEPQFSVEAACQVAHALGVSAVTVEEDFFTAVDDLNNGEEDRGSAHMGEQGFASALFYHYICISRDLLVENLGGNVELANQAIVALTEAALTVSPTGKQNSFASRSYATYALAEIGDRQPRSLAVAFFQPIQGANQLQTAIDQLHQQREQFDHAYGPCAAASYQMNVHTGEGTLAGLLDFVRQ